MVTEIPSVTEGHEVIMKLEISTTSWVVLEKPLIKRQYPEVS